MKRIEEELLLLLLSPPPPEESRKWKEDAEDAVVVVVASSFAYSGHHLIAASLVEEEGGGGESPLPLFSSSFFGSFDSTQFDRRGSWAGERIGKDQEKKASSSLIRSSWFICRPFPFVFFQLLIVIVFSVLFSVLGVRPHPSNGTSATEWGGGGVVNGVETIGKVNGSKGGGYPPPPPDDVIIICIMRWCRKLAERSDFSFESESSPPSPCDCTAAAAIIPILDW